MAVSTMKKMTLLAEKENLSAVMLSLQSYQAVELMTTTVENQRALVNEYFNVDNEDVNSTEEYPADKQIFKNISNESKINHLTGQIDKIEEYVEFLEEVLPSPGFLEKLRFEKKTYTLYEIEDLMADLDIDTLIHEAQGLRSHINKLNQQKEVLEEEREFLNRWKSLNFNPKDVADTKITEVFIGAIDSERNDALHEALHSFNELYIEELHYTDEETIYLIVTSNQEAEDVENILIRHRFERLHYQYDNLPAVELKRNREELNSLHEKIVHVEEKPEEYKGLLDNLKLTEEYLYSKRERLLASEDVLVSENLFVLTGWIEEDELDKQVKDIEKRIGKDSHIVTVNDVTENEIDDVPIKFKNSRSTSAFENVVSMYSVPKYGEMDPTPFVQPFSILFFGMMTADAGYGLLGLIAIFIGLKFLNLSSAMKKNLEFFGQLMIGTTLAGLFFGSFFGFELPFKVMSLSDQLLEIMVLSMGIGLVHLILGLFLNIIKNNRKKDYATSFTDGYAWILILLAAIALAANMFFGGPAIVITVALGVIVLSLLGTVLVNFFSNENKVDGAVQGVFSIFDITGYIGDIISYTRLTALGVASANIGMAFNLIIGLLPPLARFTIGILIFIGLHLFNMFIAMISGYVHTLRLNYVEFFGKFYTGGGREFSPIATLQKHILIRNNSTQ